MIRAKKFDIQIFRGTDFPFDIAVVQSDGTTAVDLTGWTVKCEIRKRQDRNAPLIAAFTVSMPDPATGEIFMSLTDTETTAIPAGEYFYDVLFTDPADKDWVYLYGTASVSGTVTAK